MNKLVFATALVATLILAACGSSAPVPSPSGAPSAAPSQGAVSPEPTIQPSPSASPSVEPTATPAPTPAPTAKPTPKPTPVAFNRAEKYLIEGIMRGESDCSPVRGNALPGHAIAGIDCDLVASPAARMGFYLFKNDDDMLDAYMARVSVENLIVDSGACVPGVGEGAYIPYGEDEFAPARHACYLNDQGYGNYRATLPGVHVYMGLLGRTKDMRKLEDWAWFGNQDTPGSPTLWQQDHVYRP
ncbi:MAG TPA: hypothetical protein VFN41_13870 [Candidatus Limnocylindrales bacterium]|nr:hypothetical protein [Candidatus Limnocylindrales bacterium]